MTHAAVARAVEMIVWIASYPRSGNTLVRAVLYYAFGIKSASVYREPPGRYPLQDELTLEGEIGAFRESPDPVFVKTHRLAAAADASPAIYVVRDGRDALVSHAHFLKETDAPAFRDLRFGHAVATLVRRRGARGWSDSVRSWTGRSAPTAVVRYEDLIESPVDVVAQAARSLGVRLPPRSGELPSFQSLREKDPTLVRRGEIGSWRSELPSRLEPVFWRRHGTAMELVGYER